jgi:hypothetical protein
MPSTSLSIEQMGRKKVRLGSVTDDELFNQLSDRIKALGGTMEDLEWDLDGSRQKTTYAIKLPEGELKALADTEEGLFLQGEEKLISLLMQEPRPDPVLQGTPAGGTEP